MNIYFVNKNSKLKGPFDIIDAKRQHIIKVGDICICDSDKGLKVLYVVSSCNTWNACKCIGIGSGKPVSDGNTLLFSFDGISRRFGNIEALTQLESIFTKEPISSLLRCALDITSYKRDFWDIEIFKNIIECSPMEDVCSAERGNKTPNPTGILFASYLDQKCLDLFNECQGQKLPLRDTYSIIKTKYQESFRKSLIEFMRECPNSTIYDKS